MEIDGNILSRANRNFLHQWILNKLALLIRFMREKAFVEQNKEKWERFENLISSSKNVDPEEIKDLYADITADLSYARTHYNKRSIRVYLNKSAQTVFLSLYRYRKEKFKGFIHFWKETLPLSVYKSRRELNLSLFFFLFAMFIGVFSSVHDPDFAKVILGERYVSMTEENIAQGQPMAVYNSADELDMFFRITFNNIQVAFYTYVLGAFFAVGSLIILLFNGIMVGSFQYFFIERDLFAESFLTIWMHGALEISAIVIAGGAGLTMGRSLVFTGTLPRLHSFQIGARRSINIMIGLIPVFITAGFIEGFITRMFDLPDFFRAAFIAACFILIGLYFWWYPYRKFAGSPPGLYDMDELNPPERPKIKFRKIRKPREVFSDTFTLYRLLAVQLAGAALGLGILYTLGFAIINGSAGIDEIEFRKFTFYNLYQFHSYTKFPRIFFLNLGCISLMILFAFMGIRSHFRRNNGPELRIDIALIIKIVVIAGLFELAVLSANPLVVILGVTAIPFLGFWLVTGSLENSSLANSFSTMLSLLKGTKRQILVSFLTLLLVCCLLLFIVDAPLTWLYVDMVQWNIDASDEIKKNLALLSIVCVNITALFSVIPLLIFAQFYEYFAASEAKNADDLKQRVSRIGAKKRVYGLEKE
jgi:uncharacterized membrane protein SpoIIM required for sporulation